MIPEKKLKTSTEKILTGLLQNIFLSSMARSIGLAIPSGFATSALDRAIAF
jgi:hypothetical protein